MRCGAPQPLVPRCDTIAKIYTPEYPQHPATTYDDRRPTESPTPPTPPVNPGTVVFPNAFPQIDLQAEESNGVLTGVSSHRYNTRSNKVRVIKTPGGHLRYLHIKKKGSPPKCGDCGICLPGVPSLRPRQYSQISKPQKTVQRAYGGSRCANCVKDRVVRAFLIEEQKIVKKVLKEAAAKRK
ncbi:hypothetical protein Q9L58_005305 [Maublancomyces gigas]|uniref:60S ribosomal protein L34 n=1 Tax=Discina gigas TaxID=1032678 RepID=A0ABR3GJ34_9PEZI